MEMQLNSPKRSKTYEHAKHEFEILLKSAAENNRPIVEPFMSEILELVEAFGKFGQSGVSAVYIADAITEVVYKCLMNKPLCPITGIVEEWVNVSEANGGVYLFQNNRLPTVFKDLKGAYYLDAIVFVRGKGAQRETFTSGGVSLPSGGYVASKQYVSVMPFKPKTFYIDVTRVGDFVFVKDEKQLEAVWKYYKKQSAIITN